MGKGHRLQDKQIWQMQMLEATCFCESDHPSP